MKSQNPSTKPGPRPEGGDSEGEITNKSQIPIPNDQNRFEVLSFGHCDLEFLFFQHSMDGDARWVLQPAYIM
jgi:hypothetical protein